MNTLRTLAIALGFGIAPSLGIGIAVAGCTSADASAAPQPDCKSSAVPGYANVAAFKKCTMCHSTALSSGARNQAPPELNFNTYEGASSVSNEIALQVSEGRMPPPASGIKLSEAEKQQLLQWADCGAPR